MNKINTAQEQIASLIAENMPNQIMDFKFSEELQNRIQQLVNNKKDGVIITSESKELDKYLAYDLLIGLAKSKAFKYLNMVIILLVIL
jgi:hypothetical protein